MILNNIKTRQKDSGFTIVELLVVIVVIGILAAITLVSYSGITARANTASAQSAANAAIAKINNYMVDAPTPATPTTFSALTGAAPTTTYYLTGVTFATTILAATPATPSTLNFVLCGTSGTSTAPTSYATITVPSGVQINYWKYDGTPGVQNYTVGTTSGTYQTFPVACFISTT